MLQPLHFHTPSPLSTTHAQPFHHLLRFHPIMHLPSAFTCSLHIALPHSHAHNLHFTSLTHSPISTPFISRISTFTHASTAPCITYSLSHHFLHFPPTYHLTHGHLHINSRTTLHSHTPTAAALHFIFILTQPIHLMQPSPHHHMHHMSISLHLHTTLPLHLICTTHFIIFIHSTSPFFIIPQQHFHYISQPSHHPSFTRTLHLPYFTALLLIPQPQHSSPEEREGLGEIKVKKQIKELKKKGMEGEGFEDSYWFLISFEFSILS